MNPIALGIIVAGVPLALIGFFMTRAYCRAGSTTYPPQRESYRAHLFNSTEADLRAASDGAVIAAGIVSGTVIHS
jgi:hypothetical protein